MPWSPFELSFDAAGQQSASTQTTSRLNPLNSSQTWTTVYDRTNSFDGNGEVVKLAESSQTNSSSPNTSATFYLRSTVTGNVLAEYDGTGQKRKSNVYMGSELIAQQITFGSTANMLWQHKNPVTDDGLTTDSNGHSEGVFRRDNYGVNIGDTDPFSGPDPGFGDDSKGVIYEVIPLVKRSLSATPFLVFCSRRSCSDNETNQPPFLSS